jgi:predicted urease superfamily metal-dependent hydrolase
MTIPPTLKASDVAVILDMSFSRGAMSESDFLNDLRRDYGKLQPSARKQKIRKLVAESKEDEKFVMKFFPEFYAEAFPSRTRAAGRLWGSNSRSGLSAKRR